MKIAHIHGFAKRDGKLKFFVNYLEVREEDDDSFTVANHEDGLEPRSNWLSKEIDTEAAEDGYASLNMPCWISCDSQRLSGIVYVLEGDEEKGKELLKTEFLEILQQEIEELEGMRKLVFQSK